MLFRSNDTATTEIYTVRYTLSLHDALPISTRRARDALFRAVVPRSYVCASGEGVWLFFFEQFISDTLDRMRVSLVVHIKNRKIRP